MSEISDNVRVELIKLIPSSLLSDVVCFAFYDHHPRDEKNIDITICTKNGELKEFFQRDLLSTLPLNCVSTPTDVKILRNKNCELFYLVATEDELFIISCKDSLLVHKKLSNVKRYDVVDTVCSGQTCLKVIRKDDAVPIFFDRNFESLEDNRLVPNWQNEEESLPVMTQLKRKLVEAKYAAKCNKNTFEECVNLRQRVELSISKNLHPNADDSVFKMNEGAFRGALKIKTQTPWVKVCNKKFLIVLNVLNEYKEPLDNIHVLLHSSIQSLTYTTKLFEMVHTSPFWCENATQTLKCSKDTAVVCVVALDEIKLNAISRVELKVCISYKMSGKEYLSPVDNVVVSSLDMMGDEFDALSNSKAIEKNIILSILASTEKTDLHLRHIRNKDESNTSLIDMFCKYLQMERFDNVIVHGKSPYHALNGTMIVFNVKDDTSAMISVHSRSPSQVQVLLYCMYDAIPAKIIATTPNYKITAKTDELSHYNEDISAPADNFDYNGYASSMLNRTAKILEHLDNSMIIMSESKNPSVQSRVGSHIDLFAGGLRAFEEFRENVLNDAEKGVDGLLCKSGNALDSESEGMVID